MLYFWVLIGALIGISAALHRGFNIVAGLLAGALLGPFAIMMYGVSGDVHAQPNRVKCEHCDAWIPPDVHACPRCRHRIAAA